MDSSIGLKLVSSLDSYKNNIVFRIDNDEKIKITPKFFYVEGRKVTNDKKIYEAFKSWIDDAIDSNREKL